MSAPNLTTLLQSTQGLGVRPLQVGGQERLQDARVELALQVHHVERDVELRGYASRILGGVQGAAAPVELRGAVRHVAQAHPDADGLVAAGLHQRRRDGRVHAAGHRDENARHSPVASAAATASTGRESAAAR